MCDVPCEYNFQVSLTTLYSRIVPGIVPNGFLNFMVHHTCFTLGTNPLYTPGFLICPVSGSICVLPDKDPERKKSKTYENTGVILSVAQPSRTTPVFPYSRISGATK